MLSRFHPILERYRQTDGQMDRIAISTSHVSVLTRDKNQTKRENEHNKILSCMFYWLSAYMPT